MELAKSINFFHIGKVHIENVGHHKNSKMLDHKNREKRTPGQWHRPEFQKDPRGKLYQTWERRAHTST